ncbi:MAG: hypothetical protein SGJ27_18210 [Candidatus Melainabacteria bacterium]|nr:hypothetical protein [Candidatus Melainabacteria bacterium]
MSNSDTEKGLYSTTGGAMEEAGIANPPTLADRSTYEKNMETRLSELGAKIDDLSVKAGEVKEQASTKLKELKEKQQEASVKLQSMKETSTEAWGEFKHGMDNAVEELSKAWEEMKAGCSSAASKFDK